MHLAFDPFKQLLQTGESIKRRAIIDLFNKTMSGQKRLFLRWSHTVQTQNSITRCRKTIEFFDALNTLISSAVLTKCLTVDDLQTAPIQAKRVVAEKLLSNSRARTKEAYTTWKDCARTARFADAFKL